MWETMIRQALGTWTLRQVLVVIAFVAAKLLASPATKDLDPRSENPSRPLILAYVVSGSDQGMADGIYLCANSAFACAHLQKPLLRLEERIFWVGDEQKQHVQRKIFNGAVPIYHSVAEQPEVNATVGKEANVDWPWLHASADPPRDAPSLAVVAVRNTGCSDELQKSDSGGSTDAHESAILEIKQLGNVYRREGRLVEAAACYRGLLGAGGESLDRQQRCRLRLALCRVGVEEKFQKAKARTGGGDGRLTSSSKQRRREKAECLSDVLLEREGECGSMAIERDAAIEEGKEEEQEEEQEALLNIGVVRLCEEWDVSGALDHFLAAAIYNHHREGRLGEEEEEEKEMGGQVPREGGPEWGAVWLAQAIRGQSYEASIGFAANITSFGEAWATAHLESWRRRLCRECSGIGMAGVIEGAERLIRAGVEMMATMHVRNAEGRAGDGYTAVMRTEEVGDLHVTLSRTLILHGAFEEANGHAGAATRLATIASTTAKDERRLEQENVATRGSSRDGGGFAPKRAVTIGSPSATASASLRLEVELLSRTPVVLLTTESAASLRKELLGELRSMRGRWITESRGSIMNPLEVGVRAQFLVTYQGLNDKTVAIAFGETFDVVSGGKLSYYSPHLLVEHAARDGSTTAAEDGTGNVDSSLRNSVAGEAPPCCELQSVAATGVPDRPSGAASTGDIGTAAAAAVVKEVAATRTTKATSQAETETIPVARVRVGFLSAHFGWHSVGRLTVGLLERLGGGDNLEIFVIDAFIDGQKNTAEQPRRTSRDSFGRDHGGGKPDFEVTPIAERLDAAGVTLVRLSAAVAAAARTPCDSAEKNEAKEVPNGRTDNHAWQRARKAVAALKLDVLVYADVGMDALTTGLAHARLSPVQVAFWGHPSTTGLPTMDYFITSDLFEGEFRGAGGDTEQVRKRRYSCKKSESCGCISSGCSNSSSSKAEKLSGGQDNAERNSGTIDTAADDAVLRGEDEQRGATRQQAFSEQLVRLDGLGVIFDDPTITFGWDPICAEAVSLPGTDRQSQDSLHHLSGKINEESRAATVQHQTHKVDDSSRSDYTSPGSPSHDRGVVAPAGSSPEVVARKKATATSHEPRLYVCAQSLMKLHPAFDTVLADILAADPFAQIILLRDSRQLLWHSRFRRRLKAEIDAAEQWATTQRHSAAAGVTNGTAIALPADKKCANIATSGADSTRSETWPTPQPLQPGDFWRRVRFVAPLSGRDFFRLQCRADVVLDPFPFGGGVTTLEALSCGTPVVTAGALQSVHRLAEGMIAAAAAAAAASQQNFANDENLGRKGLDGVGEAIPKHSRRVPRDDDSSLVERRTVGLEGGRGGVTEVGKHTNGTGTQSARQVDCDAPGTCSAVSSGGGDVALLVNALVARTTGEYVEKAVAVAAPGALKDSIRHVLCVGREGMLSGDEDSVATDWERFLKRAAASAPRSRGGG